MELLKVEVFKSPSAFSTLVPKIRVEVPTCTSIYEKNGTGLKRAQYWQ